MISRGAGRRLTVALSLLFAALPASAYYHFVHYLKSGSAPEKFDLSTLPNKTVTFLVSENGPALYSPGDTFGSVINQIQQALAVWNGVASSDLRVAFGGLENASTLQNAPGGDVVFDDLPPGVEGFGGPTALTSPVIAPDGSRFFPIVRSVVHLNRNLALVPGPSYSQGFVMTTLHEFGHALGLQHTFTSSTMSQDTTRATTLTHPLDNDDIAGISALYPNAAFKQFGSISGRITSGGHGVHLASVVAIQSGAGAVSAVTSQDGSYLIAGVPAGQYAVYVHTMPPDADIYGPWNNDGSVAASSNPVNSVFYPGGTDFSQAAAVIVAQGANTDGIDIATAGRASVPWYDGQIFGYFGATAIRPAPVNVSLPGLTTVAASVVGLGLDGAAPGLAVQIPGDSISVAPDGVRPYQAGGYTYIALDLSPGANPQTGPQHLIFTTPDYMYVLPSAMYLTSNGPPGITAVNGNGDGTLTVTGTNWVPGTLIYFDSLPASILSIDPVAGVALITPPAGTKAQQSTVAAYNPDGQNSQFLQSAAPVIYSYGNLPVSSVTSISPSSLPAGSEATIDITGSGFAFSPGATSVGFGTSDIVVRRVFILSAGHLQVNVSVSPDAALSNADVSVISGFQVATVRAGFHITSPVAGFPVPVPVLVNAFTLSGITGAYPGAIVSLYGTNLAIKSPAARITIGGQIVPISYWSAIQVNLEIPSNIAPGPAILTLNNGLVGSRPLTINIDPPPAGFSAVQNGTGAYIYSDLPARQGDVLIATMNSFSTEASIALNRVQVALGGVKRAPFKIARYGSIWQISFQVSASDPVGAAEQLIVYLDGRSSLPATIQVTHADGSLTP